MMTPLPCAPMARWTARLLGTLLLVAASAQAGPLEDTASAETSLRNGDLITAMQLFRKAAEQGHAPAQARLGDMMDAADQNADAVAWYRKAAEQGEPSGDYGLGRLYVEGKGLPKDPAKGLEHFRRAAQKNHFNALNTLAQAHRMGSLGLPKDPQEAARLQALADAQRPPVAARKAAP